MMTISIMKSILETISFDAQGTAYVKYYEQFSVYMKVDFSRQKVIYPEQIRSRDRNVDLI